MNYMEIASINHEFQQAQEALTLVMNFDYPSVYVILASI